MVRAEKACRRGRLAGGGGFTLIELLVVMGIMMILAGMITSAVFAFRRVTQKKGAGVDIQTFTMGLAAYRRDLGSYPPSDDTLDANEAIHYYLGTRHAKGANLYGPYVTFKTKRLRNADGDDFMEYVDPFGEAYEYSAVRDASNNIIGYEIMSAGPDGDMGGSWDAVGKFTADATDAAKDNITQRSE